MKNAVIALLILLLLGGGIYLATSGGDGDEMADNASASELTTISALLARGGTLQCNYDTVDDVGNGNAGTVYFSEGQMRGMFTLTQPGEEPVMSNVINDGMNQYIWEEGSSEGFMVPIQEVDVEDTPDHDQTPVSNDEEFDFNCSDWDADSSLFDPPSDVTFEDFGAQLDELNEALQEANEDLAGVCAGIEDADARAACEAQLQ